MELNSTVSYVCPWSIHKKQRPRERPGLLLTTTTRICYLTFRTMRHMLHFLYLTFGGAKRSSRRSLKNRESNTPRVFCRFLSRSFIFTTIAHKTSLHRSSLPHCNGFMCFPVLTLNRQAYMILNIFLDEAILLMLSRYCHLMHKFRTFEAPSRTLPHV